MNADEELRRLLTSAADSYEPPADGVKPATTPDARRHDARPRMPTARSLRIAGASLAVVGILTAIGFGISAGHSDGSSGSSTSSAASSGTAVGGSSGSSTSDVAPSTERLPAASSGSASSADTGSQSPKAANRVVQTGQVSLEVKTGLVQASLDRLASIATGAGGYLSDTKSNTGSNTGSGAAYGSSTIRVPVARFASVLAQVRRVGHVESISSQAQDVTAQYVDLGARISALAQTRATYLTLQSRTTSIGDALAVQQQIQTVQTQIEQLQGQQKVLADSSDLATLAVSVSETGPAVVPLVHKSSGFGKAWHQAVSGFTTGLKAIIRIAGPLLLIVLLLAIAGFGGRFVYRRIRRWQA